MSALSAKKVEEIAADCLFNDDKMSSQELPDNAICAEGIIHKYGFHPERLSAHKVEIGEMLAELPNEFQPSPDGGGGWSFLNACVDKNGVQWTGLHKTMELLFALGIATKQAAWLLPREIWPALPGGMPYVVVLARKATSRDDEAKD